MGNYLQGKLAVVHHANMYPTWFATSMSQGSLMDTWLQDDFGISWHDGSVGYHIHGSLAEAIERYCVIDATRYFYLYIANGCGVRLIWDPGGDRFDTMYWLIEDPGVGWLYLWLDEDFIVVMVLINVEQFTGAGAKFFQRVIWDPGIQLRDRLQRDIWLRNLANIVFTLDLRAACRLVWDPGTNCLRTSNFKEGRFVMFPFEH